MRITEQTRTTTLLTAIDQQQSTMNTLNQELSTGYKVNEPSDDPVATGAILRTNAYIAGLNENLSVINSAQNFSQAASTALSNSTTIIQNVQTAATQAANGTETASDLQALGSEVNQDLNALVQDSNSQFEGQYLFSGTKTDTAPIATGYDAQGNVDGIYYQGSDTDLTFPVGQDRTSPVSVTAQAAYTNVLNAVQSLRDDLNNAQEMSSQDQQSALSSDLSAINTAQSTFVQQAANVGSYQSQLTALTSQTQTSLTNAQTILSSYQDADVAQVSVNLQTAQTLYQAIVSSGANQMQQNDLFSYLTA